MALLYDMPRSATVRAITPVQIYSLSKRDFDRLLAPVPALREQLERMVVARSVPLRQSREEPAPA
jgi:putative ABC transport system ATP-binding protein